MKIQVMSDLHLDADRRYRIADEADAVVIAGDICNNLPEKGFIEAVIRECGESNQQLIYVTGNHEYYRSDLDTVEDFLVGLSAEHDHFHALGKTQDAAVIDGYHFIGDTLWSGFYGASGRNKDDVKSAVAEYINDFILIHDTDDEVGDFTTDTCERLHHEAVERLNRLMKDRDNSKTVVVTHFAPSFKSIHPKYQQDPISIVLNDYFANALDDRILEWKPSLWIHGHTHTPFDYNIGETRVLCNPKGYGNENPSFDDQLIIEL